MGQAEAKSDPPLGTGKRLQQGVKDHAQGRKSGALQLVLVGPKGSGKSSAGNSILGRVAFKTGTETVSCQTESCKIGVRDVTLVDTPGLTGEETLDLEVMKSIKKACQDFLELPVVFLLVVPLEWSTKKFQHGQQMLRHALGKISFDHLMVLITHTDQDKWDGYKEDRVLRKEGLLQLTVGQCGGWFHLFNTVESDHNQVSKLLEKVDRMILEGKKLQVLDASLEEQPRKMEMAAKSDTDQRTQEEGLDYRAEISHQKKRVQKGVELVKNSEKIVAENKELLRKLRDEIDALEEELNSNVAVDKKQALAERIQQKAVDIQSKEEKIRLHIGILQTLQQQMQEKQKHISEMEKEMREREKEHARTKTHLPRAMDGTRETGSESCMPKNDYDERMGTEGVMDMTAGGMCSVRKNLEILENQIRSKTEEEEELARERNSEYKAQLQKIRGKRGTH
ncbi:GTPase IMAP family member 4-like [Pygocentrus nattereri]|uniref:GTPase IMAP family member 4-like n=1 Tax=Pygocentrus nattereri TaxID=42514 RepID=UPI0018910044|nr:GTPase IMAP family member 4-like [Pygocentrus nattereri]